MLESIQQNVLPHWPFFVFALVTGMVAQILKTTFLTKNLAKRYKAVFFARRSLPLLLIGLGASMGFLWPGATSPGVVETLHKVWYFMGSACVSIAVFSSFKSWVKKKYDVDIVDTDTPSTQPPKKE